MKNLKAGPTPKTAAMKCPVGDISTAVRTECESRVPTQKRVTSVRNLRVAESKTQINVHFQFESLSLANPRHSDKNIRRVKAVDRDAANIAHSKVEDFWVYE